MAVTRSETLLGPRWPALDAIDPARADVSYDALADELVVYFGGRPISNYVSPIDSPGNDFAAVMVGVNEDESDVGEVVGVHVMPLLVGAVQDHPSWATLA